MRISDWSSDVCSSDLHVGIERRLFDQIEHRSECVERVVQQHIAVADALKDIAARLWQLAWQQRRKLEVGAVDQIVDLDRAADRKSVVSGKSVSVRVDLGGRGIIKKKKRTSQTI